MTTPVGWRSATLSEVARWGSGGTPAAGNSGYYGGDIPWAVIGDLNDGVVRSTAKRITEDGLNSSAAKWVPRGAVLVAMYGSIGKLGIAGKTLTTNQAIAFAVPGPDLESKFLFYYLMSQRSLLDAQGKGATQRNISQTILKLWPISVPDIAEQRRIVEALEEHLSELERVESQVRTVMQRLERLDRSVHQFALRGVLVAEDLSQGTGSDLIDDIASLDPGALEERCWPVPASWAWARIGDVFTVSVGTTPSRSDAALWGGGVPWVSSGEVAFNRIRETRETIAPQAISSRKRLHPPGTVMLAMIGEGKTRGQAAILDIEAAHNQNCASIQVSETRILPEFIYAFFKERYLETRRGSSGGNQPALNKGRIQKIPFPVPPLGTQRLIVDELDRLATATSNLRASCQSNLMRIRTLRSALLTAAFDGTLTSGQPRDSRADTEGVLVGGGG